MRSKPQRVWPGLAATKNAEARNLVVRGRLREALRVLNEIIYSAPDYPHSYANRALVFERLGMLPQAEADRERARQLAEAGGYDEEEVFATSALLSRPTQPARISRRVGREARPEGRPRLRGIPEPIILVVALAGMAATGFGLFMAADAIGGADINLKVFDFETFQSSEPEATAGPTAPPTAEPTPPPATPPPEALSGNPFSFSNLESAWKAKGITVSAGALSTGFTNIRGQPFDVTLTKGTERATLSVIIYANRNAPQDDWNLSAGQRPSAKAGKAVPAHDSIWWNTNVIVVARSAPGAIGKDALDGVLALGG
jgi:hypothetical protein